MGNASLIKRVLVEPGTDEYALGSKILRNLLDLPLTPVVSAMDCDYQGDSDIPHKNKETLLLTRFHGGILKPCPGTRHYICCGYQILHVGTNCPMDCSYCILQAYLNQPFIRIFVNLEDHLESLGRRIDSQPGKIFRIGTGEFTDSLVLDPVIGWSDILLSFFQERKNAVLEIKTKSDHIERVLSSRHRNRIIVSWSLNSPRIVAGEEHGTASLKKRLEAAKRCQSEGFILGFHFDPLIDYPHWKEDYLKTLEMLDAFVEPKGIIWISLGCFRYMPVLKKIIRKNRPRSRILDGEFITGLDGKMRYFKPIRIEMYAFIAEILKKWHKDLGIYLCMESDEVWEKSLGWSPKDSVGLSSFLDDRVLSFFR